MRSDDDEKLDAGRKEFQIQKELSHPNIAKVVEMFDIKERNTLYIVMEYISGQELHKIVMEEGPLNGKIVIVDKYRVKV